jgi:GT2 family glycosyltransferase
MRIPKICIIILNWNGIEVIESCIKSVLQTHYSNYKVLLVDNASTDGSPKVLKENFPDLKFIDNPENLGYAEGNNRGIKLAFFELAADCIVLLNNDTVVDEKWL